MKRNLSKAILCALCPLLAALPGCKKEEAPAPAPQFTQPAVKPQPPAQQQLSSAAGAGAGAGDFRSRRDPFKPYLAEKAPAQQSEAPAALVPKGDQLPIQSYEVSKFKVSGIIAGIKENRALLVDPQGKPYVVQVGMLIGDKNGRITKITANSVEVVERVRDDRGVLKKRTIVLTLAKKR